MKDLAWATSSASTKLFHGGLRYLEYFEIRLVREALIEREVLLNAMPHISWPMRFVLPYHRDMRPAWLIRLGLFMYDNLGGRKILPATRSVDLKTDPVGQPLKDKFLKAFEYSDCWIEDSRLVVLNAQDAEARGADILTRTKVLSADQQGDLWHITLQDQAESTRIVTAKGLVNAGGPWVEDILRGKLRQNTSEGVRLVRGSHIVTPKLFDHDKCYFFQGEDGRITFAIPYETDFTLIGTTDAEHDTPDAKPECTPEEQTYLCEFVSNYFNKPVTQEDIVWTYSGVRPLYDDGASSASAATREYVLTLDDQGAPLLNVFGGKITTYRKLAEAAMAKLMPHFPEATPSWTAGVSLPGGDFPVDGVKTQVKALQDRFAFLEDRWALRLVRAYGTEAALMLGDAKVAADLGKDFGATLTEAEVKWLMNKEYAHTAEDVVWRRSKLGLRLSKIEITALDLWMTAQKQPTE
ncbi:UNVERIFIED_CONTAM: hypothetical protein GTU68_055529 [Idotea baltica]|nr:hypothetical protein [Idotea baltica]